LTPRTFFHFAAVLGRGCAPCALSALDIEALEVVVMAPWVRDLDVLGWDTLNSPVRADLLLRADFSSLRRLVFEWDMPDWYIFGIDDCGWFDIQEALQEKYPDMEVIIEDPRGGCYFDRRGPIA
jgi:hypothetical protein